MIDYKKIIRNPKLRYKILNLLNFIPDALMLKLQYRIKLGRKLNLCNPKRYSEKLQWLKIYYRNPLMPQCVDKQNVREYVKKSGYAQILNENFGCYDSPEEIEFDNLPNSFVLKDTLGGGGTSVILVEDKSKIDLISIQNTLRQWVDTPTNKKNMGREWLYEGKKHRIIIEKLLQGDSNGDLPDYKFFCFNGKVFCLYMMRNYTKHHSDGELVFFDRNFNLMDVHRTDFRPIVKQPEKPKNYDKMIEIAEVLSSGFPHVRVDLYNINGEIVFGEMTFFNASGYVQFVPDKFDFEMGDHLVLM